MTLDFAQRNDCLTTHFHPYVKVHEVTGANFALTDIHLGTFRKVVLVFSIGIKISQYTPNEASRNSTMVDMSYSDRFSVA